MGGETREAILQTALRQMQLAKEGEKVPCTGCGWKLPAWRLYRCYYCGRYFCEGCCPGHFGKSRTAYNAELVSRETATHATQSPLSLSRETQP